MTDLTLQEAIAELRQMELTYGQLWTAREVMQTRNADNCKTIATILNAVVSGELIPLADHKLAVALVVEASQALVSEHYSEIRDHEADRDKMPVRIGHVRSLRAALEGSNP